MGLREHRLKFETDAKFQTKIHLLFTYLWIVNMVTAVSIFVFANAFWAKYSILYVILISLYANFATDYGAVSAAQASEAAQKAAVAAQKAAEKLAGKTKRVEKIAKQLSEDADVIKKSKRDDPS